MPIAYGVCVYKRASAEHYFSWSRSPGSSSLLLESEYSSSLTLVHYEVSHDTMTCGVKWAGGDLSEGPT